MTNRFDLIQKSNIFICSKTRDKYNIEDIRSLILEGYSISVFKKSENRRTTKEVLSEILFLHHNVSSEEKLEYVKNRSVSSLHNEIRILSPFEEKHISHYKNFDYTIKFLNPHNFSALV